MDKTIVVKLGGSTLQTGHDTPDTTLHDLLKLQTHGYKIVLVHGGGNATSDLLTRLGQSPRFLNGLRVTDPAALQAATMVMRGAINSDLVASFNKAALAAVTGHNKPVLAIGLSGVDGSLLESERDTGHGDIGLVGRITKVNLEPVLMALEWGYMPIIAPIGTAVNDPDTATLNLNADTVAAHLAKALQADTCVFLTDVAGVLDKDKKTIKSLDERKCQELMADGTISGGMIPKIEAALKALEGSNRVVILDGRQPHVLYEAVAEYAYHGTTLLNRLGMSIKLDELPTPDEHWPFDLRPTPVDAELIGRLCYQAYHGTIDGFGSEAEEIEETRQGFEGAWGEYLGNASFAVYMTDETGQSEIIGATQVMISRSTDLPLIGNIFVLPEMRGRRVGYNLLVRTLHNLRDLGYEECILWVSRGNEAAYNLYRNIGFQPPEATPSPTVAG